MRANFRCCEDLLVKNIYETLGHQKVSKLHQTKYQNNQPSKNIHINYLIYYRKQCYYHSKLFILVYLVTTINYRSINNVECHRTSPSVK